MTKHCCISAAPWLCGAVYYKDPIGVGNEKNMKAADTRIDAVQTGQIFLNFERATAGVARGESAVVDKRG